MIDCDLNEKTRKEFQVVPFCETWKSIFMKILFFMFLLKLLKNLKYKGIGKQRPHKFYSVLTFCNLFCYWSIETLCGSADPK